MFCTNIWTIYTTAYPIWKPCPKHGFRMGKFRTAIADKLYTFKFPDILQTVFIL